MAEVVKQYRVIPNVGEEFTIGATRVEFNPESNRITMWNGTALVAAVAGGTFHLI